MVENALALIAAKRPIKQIILIANKMRVGGIQERLPVNVALAFLAANPHQALHQNVALAFLAAVLVAAVAALVLAASNITI